MRTEAHEPCALERKQVPRKLRREKSALREFPHEILAEETDQSTRGPQSSAALDANMNSHTGNNFEALQQAIYKQQQQQHPMGAGRGPNHAAERSISTSSSSKPRDVRMETGGNTEVTADMVQSLLSQLPAESLQGNFQFSDPDAGGIGELSPSPGVNGRPPPPFLANKAPHERNAYSSNSEMAHTAGHRPIFDAFRGGPYAQMTSPHGGNGNVGAIASFPQIPEEGPFADMSKQTHLEPPTSLVAGSRNMSSVHPPSSHAMQGLTNSRKRDRTSMSQASYNQYMDQQQQQQQQQHQASAFNANNNNSSSSSSNSAANRFVMNNGDGSSKGSSSKLPPPFGPSAADLVNSQYIERQAPDQVRSGSGAASTSSSVESGDADSNLPSNLSVFQPSSRPSLIRREKKRRAIPIGAGARAVKTPPNADFPIGLAQPLIQSLVDGGEPLNALEHQKLLDTTTLLQSMGVHVLEPLTLYTKRELYEVMGSIAEVWKNSGKAAMKKKINKIRSNARKRKAPRNVLDAAEMKQIELLQKQIKDREHWEDAQRSRLKDAKSSNASVTPSKAESETSEMLTSYSPSAL